MRLRLLVITGLLLAGACRGAEARPSPDSVNRAGTQQPPADPRVTRADLARIDGNPNAKLWVLIVSDFQCPYCKQWHDETSQQFRREFVATGKVRLAYIQYPLKIHKNAQPAAEASMCGGAQGKFWEFHDRLFATVDKWGLSDTPDKSFAAIATELKLDIPAFSKCLSDHVMLPMVQADYQRGIQMRVRSTPSFVIGSTMIPGAASMGALRDAVDKALSK